MTSWISIKPGVRRSWWYTRGDLTTRIHAWTSSPKRGSQANPADAVIACGLCTKRWKWRKAQGATEQPPAEARGQRDREIKNLAPRNSYQSERSYTLGTYTLGRSLTPACLLHHKLCALQAGLSTAAESVQTKHWTYCSHFVTAQRRLDPYISIYCPAG